METSDKEGNNNGDRKSSNNNVEESSDDESFKEKHESEGIIEEDENKGNTVPMIVIEEFEKGEGVDVDREWTLQDSQRNKKKKKVGFQETLNEVSNMEIDQSEKNEHNNNNDNDKNNNRDDIKDKETTNEMPGLQDCRTVILTTKTNQAGQYQGGVDCQDEAESGRGGRGRLRRKGTHGVATGRTNEHKIIGGNGTGIGNGNKDNRPSTQPKDQIHKMTIGFNPNFSSSLNQSKKSFMKHKDLSQDRR